MHTIRSTSRPRAFQALAAVGLLVALGCSGSTKNGKDSVSGKVTLKGTPVIGLLSFVGADGRAVETPVNPDGTYILANPPLGQVSIRVKNFPGQLRGPGGKPPAGVVMPGGGATPAMSVPVPARYATANNGLAKFVVTGGQQTHDIELKP